MEERILVSTVALSSLLNQRIVCTVGADEKVRLTPVETGGNYGPMTAIRKGLDAGALVVTDHLQSLPQDQRVRVGRKAGSSSMAGRDEAPAVGAGAR